MPLLACPLTAPVKGEYPSYTQITGEGYVSTNVNMAPMYRNGIGWTNHFGEAVSPQGIDTFAAGTGYQVHIYLEAQSGYEFANNVTATVNGNSAVAMIENGALYVEYLFPETEKEHVHSPSSWRITQVYHYKACTTCGDFLTQDDHSGGKATCEEKAKCSVCLAEYGDYAKCDYETKWTAQGALGHMHGCKVCGGFSDVEVHVPGAAATEKTPQKCTVCDYIITPAKGQTHSLKKISEGSDEIPNAIRQGHIAYVINTRDISSEDQMSDGMQIRRCAVENNVTMFTSLDTVSVLLDVLEETTLCISTIDA